MVFLYMAPDEKHEAAGSTAASRRDVAARPPDTRAGLASFANRSHLRQNRRHVPCRRKPMPSRVRPMTEEHRTAQPGGHARRHAGADDGLQPGAAGRSAPAAAPADGAKIGSNLDLLAGHGGLSESFQRILLGPARALAADERLPGAGRAARTARVGPASLRRSRLLEGQVELVDPVAHLAAGIGEARLEAVARQRVGLRARPSCGSAAKVSTKLSFM